MQIDTEYEIALSAIIVIGILELIALIKGADGIMFGSAMTALGVIVGWICKGIHTRSKK